MSYKLSSNISDYIGKLNEANSRLSEAYDILNDVRSRIDDGTWTGKSQKVTKSLCEICDRYHKKVMENAKDEVNVLRELADSADGYMSGGRIPGEWR